jgi:mannose-6-phosphate isomerase-like protein (cupin superfamily)
MPAQMVKKSFDQPDERKNPAARTTIEVVDLGGLTFNKMTMEPGWRWSQDVKPVAKTASCQARHVLSFLSGRLRVRMDDGKEEEFGPGDIAIIPAGHDAWVVGDEPNVSLEMAGAVKS